MADKILSQTLRDPFKAARDKYDSGRVLSEVKDNSAPDASVVGGTSPQQVAAYDASTLPNILRQAGIDDKGLAFNDIGRFQLIGRLKRKFGEGFNKDPMALDILSAFNEKLSSMEDGGAGSLTSSISSADRTLKAILGG
jgi:hypothetical protein